MIKIEVFPIKVCVKSEAESDKLESIMTVNFEPDEESFKNTDTPPNININLMVESNKEEDINYISELRWFDHFFARTGIGDLLTRVNFACNINVRDDIEFSEEAKEKLNAAFAVFVSKLQSIISDYAKYSVMWAQSPIFTVTLGTKDEIPEEEHDHEHPHDHVHEEETPSEAVEDESKSD